MRRAISIVPAVLAVAAALILIMGRADTAFSGKGKPCTTRILHGGTERSYDCNVAIDGDGTGTMHLDFSESIPPEDGHLDVIINNSVAGACACSPRGKKQLEKGGRFRCIMDNVSIGDNTSVGDFDILGSTIEGRPNKNGNKIKAGQGTDEDGTSIFFDCVESEAP